MSNRRRHTGSRANPDPNTCLGVFGLSLYTTERDLREVFSRYGPLSGVNVVYDQRTGRSRGFAFVYFERIDDEILTTIEDMIEAMTDTKIMITGTEEGRPLLTTVATGHDRDPVPIVQDAIDTGVIVPEDFAFSSF